MQIPTPLISIYPVYEHIKMFSNNQFIELVYVNMSYLRNL